MSKKIAVIGAGGYIGKHLCQRLASSGMDVVRVSAGEPSGISLNTGMFTNELVFSSDVDTVYYLAQSPRYRQMPEQSAHLLSVNCVAAVQAAEAARCAGVRRFIYASTGNVYEPSFLPISETAKVRRDNWYALSKVMAEEALALYRPSLDVTIARIFGVYGPGQTDKLVPNIADKIANQQDVMLDRNALDQHDSDGLSVSLIYIDDLIQALIVLKDISMCQTINIGGSEAVSVRQLAETLASCLGIKASITMNQSSRHLNLLADISLQIEKLGRPITPLQEGIAKFCRARVEA